MGRSDGFNEMLLRRIAPDGCGLRPNQLRVRIAARLVTMAAEERMGRMGAARTCAEEALRLCTELAGVSHGE